MVVCKASFLNDTCVVYDFFEIMMFKGKDASTLFSKIPYLLCPSEHHIYHQNPVSNLQNILSDYDHMLQIKK